MDNELIKLPKNRFLRAKCPACGNEQVVYSAAKSVVKCLACSSVIAEPGASKALFKGKVLKEYG